MGQGSHPTLRPERTDIHARWAGISIRTGGGGKNDVAAITTRNNTQKLKKKINKEGNQFVQQQIGNVREKT
jgi:hypothetical protein